jgi:hypothetical protein
MGVCLCHCAEAFKLRSRYNCMEYNLFQYADPSVTRRQDTQLAFEIADCKDGCCTVLRDAFVVRGIVTRERMAMTGTRGQRIKKVVVWLFHEEKREDGLN